MTFNELIAHVSGKTGMAKEGVKMILETSIATLTEKAIAGEDATLPGFGQFKVKDVPARQGRNPSTGATMDIPASRKVAFTPAKALKDALKA
ncbi:HU family DNA-binding protein [Acidisoma cellulosilytica]|uniref:HU family DNA-binding protein n=1 Tax=Acidisoma cellulosilyticum TaxID=2802395 RepID=A0A963Z4N4_9PROT|nr:HU family DNA-binding protein [Acidisoma cellulosilyticum]MCB8882712.1 HU family DNA-binding protein [Acidisoma cellulosilyticum]